MSNIEKVWSEYSNSKTTELRNRLINQLSPVVNLVVERLMVYVFTYEQKNTLIDFGVNVAICAIDSYSSDLSINFETYVKRQVMEKIRIKIKLSISNDVVVRNQKLEEIYSTLFISLGRKPSEIELLHIMPDVSLETLINKNLLVSYSFANIYDIMYDNKDFLFTKLSNLISELNYLEQIIISLFYCDELTLAEICNVLSLTNEDVVYKFSFIVLYFNYCLGNQSAILF